MAAHSNKLMGKPMISPRKKPSSDVSSIPTSSPADPRCVSWSTAGCPHDSRRHSVCRRSGQRHARCAADLKRAHSINLVIVCSFLRRPVLLDRGREPLGRREPAGALARRFRAGSVLRGACTRLRSGRLHGNTEQPPDPGNGLIENLEVETPRLARKLPLMRCMLAFASIAIDTPRDSTARRLRETMRSRVLPQNEIARA